MELTKAQNYATRSIELCPNQKHNKSGIELCLKAQIYARKSYRIMPTKTDTKKKKKIKSVEARAARARA